MTEELKALKQEILDLQIAFYEKGQEFINTGLKNIFKDFANLNSISVSVSNHEFNDGDATTFSVYYEGPDLNDFNWNEFEEGNDEENLESSDLTYDEAKAIVDDIKELFSGLDDILEFMYSDAYGSIEFNRYGDLTLDGED